MRFFRPFVLLTIAAVLSGCAVTQPDPATRIIGSWQGEVGGFTVVSVYSATDVSINGHSPLPYTLDGNRLTVDGDANTAREISFPSRDEMIQSDPLTMTEHRYLRTD